MKQNRIIYCTAFLCLTFFVAFSFSACNRKSLKSAPQTENQAEKEAPESLEKMESEIKGVIEELDKKEDEKSEEKITIESKTEIKQEESQEEAKTETKQETEQEIKKESPDDKMWEAAGKRVENIHKEWNKFQPEIVKTGIPKETLDKFSDGLNNLTIYADSKDLLNTLFAANELTQFISDFMTQYNSEVPPDVKRMGYFIRDAKYNGIVGQWEKSSADIDSLKSHWTIVKTQVKKEQEKQASQMEFSIYELEKVVKQSNLTLTLLKSDIALDNLNKLEEAFKK